MGLPSEHVYDSDDEFNDFVSLPPPPPPPSWQSLHPTTKAPFDIYVCSPIYLMYVPSLGFGLCQCLSLVYRCVGFFGSNYGSVNHMGLDHFHYSIYYFI